MKSLNIQKVKEFFKVHVLISCSNIVFFFQGYNTNSDIDTYCITCLVLNPFAKCDSTASIKGFSLMDTNDNTDP